MHCIYWTFAFPCERFAAFISVRKKTNGGYFYEKKRGIEKNSVSLNAEQIGQEIPFFFQFGCDICQQIKKALVIQQLFFALQTDVFLQDAFQIPRGGIETIVRAMSAGPVQFVSAVSAVQMVKTSVHSCFKPRKAK